MDWMKGAEGVADVMGALGTTRPGGKGRLVICLTQLN